MKMWCKFFWKSQIFPNYFCHDSSSWVMLSLSLCDFILKGGSSSVSDVTSVGGWVSGKVSALIKKCDVISVRKTLLALSVKTCSAFSLTSSSFFSLCSLLNQITLYVHQHLCLFLFSLLSFHGASPLLHQITSAASPSDVMNHGQKYSHEFK